MLAYVFWHRPASGSHDYERRLTAFHDVIGVESTWNRVTGLPWMGGLDGYEDWYLVDDWAALGALNERAVSGPRRRPHDAAAAEAEWGQAGIYALKRGSPDLHGITHAAWRSKPKWVVSRSLKSVGPNATLVEGDIESVIRGLKAQPDGEIEVAGPELAGCLTNLGLIDEYRLYVHPTVLGRGKPFFSGPRPPLRFVASDLIDENVIRLRYVPA